MLFVTNIETLKFFIFYIIYFFGLYVCPRSSDPFYVVTYYIKWATTSWTYNNYGDFRDCQIYEI